jgi:cysteine desulfurase
MATGAPCKIFCERGRENDVRLMSSGRRTYLDYNATAPLRPEVRDALAHADSFGNPSSVHAEGRAARAQVEAARDKVARLVGAQARNIIFTSGGTEANNTVLAPSLRRSGGAGMSRLLVGATEHVSVLDGHRFPSDAAERIPVDRRGIIDLAWLGARLARAPGEAFLVSLQAANNETGVIQPLAEAAQLVHERGGLIHGDAVQAAGKVPLDIAELEIDVLTLSAHKLGGPKGAGAIVLASDRLEIGDRLIRGGGQERGHRAGTDNVPGIVAFGVAADIAGRDLARKADGLLALRDACEAELRRIAPDAVVFGHSVARLPNTLSFAVPGMRAETALIAFDLEGVAVSSGSACSSGKVRRSHVLEAMGIEARLAEGAIRVSLGWNSTQEDVKAFAAACEKHVATLYKHRATAA